MPLGGQAHGCATVCGPWQLGVDPAVRQRQHVGRHHRRRHFDQGVGRGALFPAVLWVLWVFQRLYCFVLQRVVPVASHRVTTNTQVTITMTGPATVWFAVGFNAPNQKMMDQATPCLPRLHRDGGLTAATSASALGRTSASSAPGLGSRRPHLHRDCAPTRTVRVVVPVPAVHAHRQRHGRGGAEDRHVRRRGAALRRHAARLHCQGTRRASATVP